MNNTWLEFGPGAGPVAVIDHEDIYREAGKAFEALAVLLGESGTGWFFGVDKPGVFDAGVFAYTYLVMEMTEGGLAWRDDGRLDRMVRKAGGGELVRHRERIWEMCWGRDGMSKGLKEE